MRGETMRISELLQDTRSMVYKYQRKREITITLNGTSSHKYPAELPRVTLKAHLARFNKQTKDLLSL